MSLSDVGLRKQFKDWFSFTKKEKTYTPDDVFRKTMKCDMLFEDLHECARKHGWNDNHCQVTIKPKYDRCIIKRDKIKHMVENY